MNATDVRPEQPPRIWECFLACDHRVARVEVQAKPALKQLAEFEASIRSCSDVLWHPAEDVLDAKFYAYPIGLVEQWLQVLDDGLHCLAIAESRIATDHESAGARSRGYGVPDGLSDPRDPLGWVRVELGPTRDNLHHDP